MSHKTSGNQPHVRSALEGVDLKKPLHEGYMYKQAHTHHGFNLRYFALYPGVLLYFQDDSDYKRDVKKGSLGVSRCMHGSKIVVCVVAPACHGSSRVWNGNSGIGVIYIPLGLGFLESELHPPQNMKLI